MASYPYNTSIEGRKLIAGFLDSNTLQQVLPKLSHEERKHFVYLWLIEGIPFAFREIPLLYGDIRNWLASRLDIPIKDVTLVGSARIGFSFAKFGKPFGPHSDLDFAIVSERWFQKLQTNFTSWDFDFKNGKIEPTNDTENKHWNENINRIPENIRRGFITADLLPNRYDAKQSIGTIMWALNEKLKRTEGSPVVRRASIRVYRDWNSLINQCNLNLSIVARSISN
jgi:hypothetical protein